jgi:hypothetical protein
VEQFKADLPAVLLALRAMIDKQETGNADFRAAQAKFLTHAQEAINPALGEADVREMLIQHILTEEIFANVFDDSDFHQHNNVARELYALEGAFFTGALKKTHPQGPGNLLRRHPRRRRADQQPRREADLPEGHLRELLQGLQHQGRRPPGRGLHPQRDRALHDRRRRLAVRKALWQEPDRPDVDILDPATGTGTFICELLEHFRGQPKSWSTNTSTSCTPTRSPSCRTTWPT